MLIKKLQKDKLFLGGFIALVLAMILGIALGAAALAAKNGIWSFTDVYKLAEHGKATMALAIITLIVGLVSLALIILMVVQPEMLSTKVLLILSTILLLIVIIFGAIAVDYANYTVGK
ncbi:MAG: hypothetical protein HRT98_01805 [Mycoplasmatales bacterium]|nr:hypothetical protein [Mycoplasmatales bacterium]